MGHFPSCGHQCVLVAINYVSKWVETIVYAKNDVVTVSKFLKKNILRFGTSLLLISDEGTHFINRIITNLILKFNVKHRVATAYHPQANGQAKVSNREIKSIFYKVVSTSRKDWTQRLDEALLAYKTAYKTPIGIALIFSGV